MGDVRTARPARWIAAAAVAVAMTTASCGSTVPGSPVPEGANADTGTTSETSAAKADITKLTKDMFLAEDEFPPVAGGSYTAYGPVRKAGGGPPANCTTPEPTGDWQFGGAIVRSPEAENGTMLTIAANQPDFAEWSARCWEPVEVAGLPEGTIAWVREEEGRGRFMHTGGFVRGVCVSAGVRDVGRTDDQLRADLVRIHNRQAEKLEKL